MAYPTDLECKNFIKYLGLLIDENLSWKTHIHSVANKISETIGLIARLRHIVPTCTLPNICQSLITPYLTYCLISWGKILKERPKKAFKRSVKATLLDIL